MYNIETIQISLESFRGPLDLLLDLAQNNEIDICDIPIQAITKQYLEMLYNSIYYGNINVGSEFMAIAASLMLIKSKMLLPQDTNNQDAGAQCNNDDRIEIIDQLLKAYSFKKIADQLSQRESQQHNFFPRGITNNIKPTLHENSNIEQLSLQDLLDCLKKSLDKASTKKSKSIKEEPWLISDKILFIKDILSSHKSLPFATIFPIEKHKKELIVTFLALLELMKQGVIYISKIEEEIFINLKNTN